MQYCRSGNECGYDRDKPYTFGFDFYYQTPEGAVACKRDFEVAKLVHPNIKLDSRLEM